MSDQTHTKPEADQVDTSGIDALKRQIGNAATVLSGYLSGPFVPPNAGPSKGTYRFRLYRSLDLKEYVEFEWHRVKWIEGHKLVDQADEQGSGSDAGTTAGGDTNTTTDAGAASVTSSASDTNTASSTTKPAASLMPQRVTVWIEDGSPVTVGGFLVGSIAANFLPPDEVHAQLMGQQMAALLAAGSIAGCSTNPQCNL